MYHISVAFQCIYGGSDEGVENGDGKEGDDISGEGKRIDTAWPLLSR